MADREKIVTSILLISGLLLITQNVTYSASAVIGNWILLGADTAGDAQLREVATAEESLGAGEIWKKDYKYTHWPDNLREYLRETEKDGGYQLSWAYTFDLIPQRNETKFYIEARTTEDDKDENMSIWWSNSKDGPWSFLGNITSAPERLYGPWDINDNEASTIYIKINDTVKDGKRSGILIDYMCIAYPLNGADIVEVCFSNNGTHAFFSVNFSGQTEPSSYTYVVYLDKPKGGWSKDFRLIYTQNKAELQRWSMREGWIKMEDIEVNYDAIPNTIRFCVPLASIANPDELQDTEVWFVVYHGVDRYIKVLDRAPDIEGYFITAVVIPDLPWPTPLIFIPIVVAAIYVIHRRRYR